MDLNQILRLVLRDVALWRSILQLPEQPNHLANMNSIAPRTVMSVDGSWNPVLGRMGCAAIIRDSSGSWSSAITVSYNYGSAFLAEILAIQLGLRHAFDIGHRFVLCLSDCSQAIHVLHPEVNITSYWNREEICGVRETMASFQDITLTKVDRAKNNTTDKLAREACRLGSPVQVWKHSPSFVYDSLFLDSIS